MAVDYWMVTYSAQFVYIFLQLCRLLFTSSSSGYTRNHNISFMNLCSAGLINDETMGYYIFSYGINTEQLQKAFDSENEALLEETEGNDIFHWLSAPIISDYGLE
jgi:hypothetical protein